MNVKQIKKKVDEAFATLAAMPGVKTVSDRGIEFTDDLTEHQHFAIGKQLTLIDKLIPKAKLWLSGELMNLPKAKLIEMTGLRGRKDDIINNFVHGCHFR